MRRVEARQQIAHARATGSAASLSSILDAFGPDAELKTRACLAKDVAFERAPARLAAELRDGGKLIARLVRGKSVRWEGETDLAALSNWEQLSARIARERTVPRVLARAYFEETFVITQNGYRMLVRVLEVGEDSMVYQRMSAQRELAGRARSCPMIVFLANFMPEAAAY
jgi:hypothetical protein